ncbi:unnamed protein product [Lota lota]
MVASKANTGYGFDTYHTFKPATEVRVPEKEPRGTSDREWYHDGAHSPSMGPLGPIGSWDVPMVRNVP